MDIISAVHGGDHEGRIPLRGLAVLPGHVLAVVVPSPDLLSIHDLPDSGAVLLGHVLALEHLLGVNLRLYRLIAGLQSRAGGLGVTFVQFYIVHLHLALRV